MRHAACALAQAVFFTAALGSVNRLVYRHNDVRYRDVCGKENCMGEGARCMTHELWASLNSRMVEFLDSVSLQKLVDEQLAKGLVVENSPMVKKAIFTQPLPKPMRVNAPNSVFALGNAFSKS